MEDNNKADENINDISLTIPSEQPQKTSKKPLLIILAVFVGLVALVFMTQRKVPIDWLTDYDAAVQKAKQQNQPMLLAFYKPNQPMVTDAFNNTYNNPKVKEFVESNFVPVLINVDEHPDLARKFKIDYYPTHYVKNADSEKLFGPRLGWDPPALFIEKLTELLNQSKEYKQK